MFMKSVFLKLGFFFITIVIVFTGCQFDQIDTKSRDSSNILELIDITYLKEEFTTDDSRPTRSAVWGVPGDLPVGGDFDRDGKVDDFLTNPDNVILSSKKRAEYQKII